MARRHSAQLELEPARPSPRAVPLPKRRGRLRALLEWCAAAAAVVACAWGLMRVDQLLATDPHFMLRPSTLRIGGLNHAPRARVFSVFAPDLGRSILFLAPEARRRRLLAIDWVQDASVSRRWPNQVLVEIRERTPVAFAMLPATPRSPLPTWEPALIDADGMILTPPPRARFDLPALYGITREQPPEARRSRIQEVLVLMREVRPYAGQISEIDVTDPDNLKITQTLNGRALRLLLGNQRYLRRLRGFLEHYPDIGRRLPAARTFDLRLDDRITALDSSPAPAAQGARRHAR